MSVLSCPQVAGRKLVVARNEQRHLLSDEVNQDMNELTLLVFAPCSDQQES